MNEPALSFAFGLFIRLSFWGPALLYKNQIKMGWILKYILSDTNYDGFFLIEKNKKNYIYIRDSLSKIIVVCQNQ